MYGVYRPYVLARTHQAAQWMAYTLRLTPGWRYLYDENTLRGCNGPDVLVESGWERTRSRSQCEELAHGLERVHACVIHVPEYPQDLTVDQWRAKVIEACDIARAIWHKKWNPDHPYTPATNPTQVIAAAIRLASIEEEAPSGPTP